MADRLKRVLVKSFIGAIALGYVLAEIMLYFVSVFTSPVAAWATRNFYSKLVPRTAAFSPLRAAASPTLAFVLLLLVWYLLLRWLYFTPLKDEEPEPKPEPTA